MNKYPQNWFLGNDLRTAGIHIVYLINKIVGEQFPEYSELFPFKAGFTSNSHSEDNFYCLQIKDTNSQIEQLGELKDKEILTSAKELFYKNHFPSFTDSLKSLSSRGFSYDTFTYIGEKDGSKFSLQHIIETLTDWLNQIVLPRVLEMNT